MKYITTTLFLLITTVTNAQTISIDDTWPWVFPGQVPNEPFAYIDYVDFNEDLHPVGLIDYDGDGFMDIMIANGEFIPMDSYTETGNLSWPMTEETSNVVSMFMANTTIPTLASTQYIPSPGGSAKPFYTTPGGNTVHPLSTNYAGCSWWNGVICAYPQSCQRMSVWDKVYEKLQDTYGVFEDKCRYVVLPVDGQLFDRNGKAILPLYDVTVNGHVVAVVYRICEGENWGRRLRFYRNGRDTGFEFGPADDNGLFVWPECGRPFYLTEKEKDRFPGNITAEEMWYDEAGDGRIYNSPLPFTWKTYELCTNGHPQTPMMMRYPYMETCNYDWLYSNTTVNGCQCN